MATQRAIWRARAVLKRAVEAGKIKRPEVCERCGRRFPPRNGQPQIEAHHYKGYAKDNALAVVWLCPMCHMTTHQEEGQARRTIETKIVKGRRDASVRRTLRHDMAKGMKREVTGKRRADKRHR